MRRMGECGEPLRMDGEINSEGSDEKSCNCVKKRPRFRDAFVLAVRRVLPFLEGLSTGFELTRPAIRIRLLLIDGIKTPKHLAHREHNLPVFACRATGLGGEFKILCFVWH